MSERVAVPTVTTEQMQAIEKWLAADVGLSPVQILDNAGRALAALARRLLGDDVTDRAIVVLAGRGVNGGGGLAAARQLLDWGAWVQIVCSYPPEAYKGAPAHQLHTLQAMGAPLAWAEEGWELPPADLLIDAIIGYGLRGAPRGPARELILLANSTAAPILSLETPSGIDTEGGQLFTPHIQAAATMTLALPKAGFRQADAAAACGDLYVADIGVPATLYSRLGIVVPDLFSRNAIAPLVNAAGELWLAA